MTAENKANLPQVLKPYTHALWDWDGNLAKTLDIWLSAYRTTLAENGITLTDKQITGSMGAFRQDLMKWGHSEAEAIRITGEAHSRVVPQLPEVALYPNAKETIVRLGQLGIKQALVTTSRRKYVETPLQRHGLHDYLRVIIPGDEVTKQKPHREPVDRALEQLGGPIGRVAIIGDSKRDLATAESASIDSVLYYPPEHELFYDLDELKKFRPTYIISDLHEVVDILLGHSATCRL